MDEKKITSSVRPKLVPSTIICLVFCDCNPKKKKPDLIDPTRKKVKKPTALPPPHRINYYASCNLSLRPRLPTLRTTRIISSSILVSGRVSSSLLIHFVRSFTQLRRRRRNCHRPRHHRSFVRTSEGQRKIISLNPSSDCLLFLSTQTKTRRKLQLCTGWPFTSRPSQDCKNLSFLFNDILL